MKPLSLRGLVNAVGLIVALATATSIPAGYFAIGYTNIASVLDFKAELNAGYLAKYIYTHDTLWQYQRLRLSELLGETEGRDKSVRKRVRDAAGRLVVEQGDYIPTPVGFSVAGSRPDARHLAGHQPSLRCRDQQHAAGSVHV